MSSHPPPQDETEKGLDYALQVMNDYNKKRFEEIKQAALKAQSKRALSRDPSPGSVPITQADVTDSGNYLVPYFIFSPGCYYLAEDIEFSPPGTGFNAIVILVDNVRLELGCHNLTQTNGQLLTNGIVAFGNNFTLTASTGAVRNFQGLGVVAPGPINNVKLSGVTVQGCGSIVRQFGVIPVDGGILIGTTDTLNLSQDVVIENVRLLENKNIGLVLGSTGDILIENTLIDETNSNFIIDNALVSVPSFYVLPLVIQSQLIPDPVPRPTNVVINDTIVQNTRNDAVQTFSPEVIPPGCFTFISAVENLTVTNCVFQDTSATAAPGLLAPFYSFVCSILSGGFVNSTFDNCKFLRSRGDSYGRGVDGFHTSANTGAASQNLQSSKNKILRNCVSDDIQGYQVTSGYVIAYGENWVIENCIAQNIRSLSPPLPLPIPVRSFANGFVLDSGSGANSARPNSLSDNERGAANNVVIKGCVAQDIDSAFGGAVGYYVQNTLFNKYTDNTYTVLSPAVNLKNYSFIGCVAQRILAHSDSLTGKFPIRAAAAGIMVDRGVIGLPYVEYDFYDLTKFKLPETLENIFVKDCRLAECHGAQTGVQYSGGVVLLGVTKAQVTGNSVTDCDAGILLNGGPAQALELGVVAATEKATVQNNTVDNCSVDGFKDGRSPCTGSFWFANKALCNGQSGSASNYNIKWCSKCPPVVKGNLTHYPRKANALSNVSMTCDTCTH